MISFKNLSLKYYDKINNDVETINNSNSKNKKGLILNIWYNAFLDFPIYNYNEQNYLLGFKLY